MEHENNNPRLELYRNFRKALKEQKSSELFYDEYELLELFDYAGELSDDYVQLEALLCGARLYPDSQALAERRLLLYMDTTDDETDKRTNAAERFINDYKWESSPIADMARLEVNPPADAPAALSYLVEQYNTFSDEEIVHLCQLTDTLGQYDWLVKNIDVLRTKARDKMVLLYEISLQADNHDDNDTLIALAEELIENDPFPVGYWIKLLIGQARKGLVEETRNTYEYAKALAFNEMPDMMVAIAEPVYNYAPYLYADMYEALKSICEKYPDRFEFTTAAYLFIAATNPKGACKLLQNYLDRHPDCKEALRQLIISNGDVDAHYTKQYLATFKTDEGYNNVCEIVESLQACGDSYNLIEILNTLDEYKPINETLIAVWVECLFAAKRYDDLYQLCQRPGVLDSFWNVPFKACTMGYMYGLSLIKLGLTDEALEFARTKKALVESMKPQVHYPIRMALQSFITFANKVELHLNDELYWDCFDMLSLGKF